MSKTDDSETILFNGNEYDEETVQQATSLVINRSPSLARDDIINRLGTQYGGDRDIYDVLGYKDELDAKDYRAKFRRQDIATRIVELPPSDTWRHDPLVTDTPETEEDSEFELAVEKLATNTSLYENLRRADTVAGIGEYGVLFIGFADNQPLEEPVNEGALDGPDDVAFYTPFGQDNVISWTLGKEADADIDKTDPLYNQPVQYTLDFGSDISDSADKQSREVHHTRIIHIAENRLESRLYGTPRLRPVYNRLDDRQRVIGASAEMFWTGAAPKYQFDIDSENSADIPDDELSQLDDEVEKLVHDMQSYIKTFNTDIEVLDGQEVNPAGVLDEIDKSIAGQTGIPKRILTGSEQAELASTQDRATWFGRIETRQNRFAGPDILRPVIDRFTDFGILPDPKNGTYEIEWPNLFELTDVEKSNVMSNRAEALQRMAPQGNTDLIASPKELFEFVVTGEVPNFDNEGQPEQDFPIPEDDEQSQNQWEAFLSGDDS